MDRKVVTEKSMHEIFRISIMLKGVNGLLELALGTVIFFTSRHTELLVALVQTELLDDPNDFLGRHASTVLQYLDPKVQLFASLYLIVHGSVKALLVWGLLRNKLWSYPAAMAVFSLFIIYQTVRVINHHSIPLIFLTIFDVIVLMLISHEYHRRLKALHIPPAA